jgi:putative SOS response-associated peptidase YedK
MPVILTTPEEVETWMTAPPDEALKLQRPVPDGTPRTVVRGVKEDLGRNGNVTDGPTAACGLTPGHTTLKCSI